MGYKKVCFHCRKAFNVAEAGKSKISLTCPQCGEQTTLFNHKFRPPKKDDLKQWKLIKFLKDHGFVYQHVYEETELGVLLQKPYPLTLEDAKIFVEKYKKWAGKE